MDWLLQLDGNALLWIQEHMRKEFLNPAMLFITSLGEAGWFWIALFLAMFFVKKNDCRKTAIMGFCALLIGFLITNLLLKNAVARVRPYEAVEGLLLIAKKPSDFSFPSGHATCSMASSAILFRNLPKKFGAPALALGILISASRLYLGVHYPTDVLAGMAVGIFAAFAAGRLLRRGF